MKNHTSLLATAVYCGGVTAASAILLNGMPAESADPGFAALSSFLADAAENLNWSSAAFSGAVAMEVSANGAADPEPAFLAFMGIGAAGFAALNTPRTRHLRDSLAALGLLIYLAPLFAAAALAVGICGQGPLFQRYEKYAPDGDRVSLLYFRTAPAASACRWQRRLLTLLCVTRIACLPLLVDVARGDVGLSPAVKAA